jgi:predicted  nucleic acid-binding Zn-ribbon protein
MYTSQPRQHPNLKLQLEGVTEDFIDEYPYDVTPDSAHPSKPKSPAAGKFTSFFGWNSSSKAQNDSESPSTTFSDKSVSPGASPRYSNRGPAKNKPAGLDIPVANSFAQPSYFNVPGTPLLSSSPQMNAHVEELERELREVSSELASSIRREMELEDEVERWKAETTLTVSDNRRTSDYYSDSGASSVRYPISDTESKLEEVETLRRKAEQERATLKVHMAERLSEELRRRRDLEEQVQQLEERVSAQPRSSPAGSPERERIRELESTLEDVKRRLSEEKQVRENFEDLLAALRQDLEQYRNERDNLRDEIVPQLKARVEGLETEASETQSLIYESTRMQQEIQHLQSENQALASKQQEILQRQNDTQTLASMQQEIQQLQSENQSLVNARRMQQDIAQQQSRIQAIAEEADTPGPLGQRVGLSRSNSLARSSAFNPKRGSLARSNSVKNRSVPESPQEGPPVAGNNPVKDLEEQRDALHRALKHLLQRQELQQREFEKRIKELEAERDKALNLTPRRTTFHKEVAHLREEVNSLRRRADDALEQKWQCEKGLGGLRMDLDRAQQETTSLRELLQEHDINIPEIRLEDQPISLDKAYNELRTTHALSIARIKQMESEDSLGEAGDEAERTLDLLKRSISDAEAERDAAQKEAEEYRQQARALQSSEIHHLGTQEKLSKELYAAATRMDELSDRIQIQLQSNRALRVRLAEAISRGEREQTKSTEMIIELERRLKTAEDKVMIAQQSSEEAVSRHEEEVQALKESSSTHLRRVKSGLLSPAAFSPKLPLSPFSQKFPRLEQTSSGPAMSFAEATKTELLEKRVEELERALRDADHEMEEVVGRMNMAQIEVADLQFERDEAMQKTRRLQADILAEREKVKALMASN